MPETQDKQTNLHLSETAGGKELAALLGITDRQVRNLADEGVAKRAGRGRYLLGESIRAVIAQAEKRASSALDAEKAALMAARRQETEMRIAEKRGELVPREEVDFTLSTVIGGMKSDLMSLPARVSRDVSIRRAIEAEIARILNSAAARMRSRGAEIAAVIDAATDE